MQLSTCARRGSRGCAPTHARARQGGVNATREGALSDTVARQGGSSTHRTQCPHFHARATVLQSADVDAASSPIRVSTAGSAPPFVSRALCTERVPACIVARTLASCVAKRAAAHGSVHAGGGGAAKGRTSHLGRWLGGTLLQPQHAWRGRRRHTQPRVVRGGGGTEGRTVGECGQCGLLEGSAGLVLPRRRAAARVTSL